MLTTFNAGSSKTRFGATLDWIITVGVMATIAFTALAHGSVEPWSIAVFSLAIVALLILWVVKGMLDRRMTIEAPPTAFPLLALLLYAAAQSVAVADADGKRFSISLDPEATRLTIEVLAALLAALIIAANFLTGSRKLAWLRNFLIFFGLALAVFGLMQYFTWNGKFYWFREPSGPTSPPFGPFVNHNHFAGYMELIAPIPVALILTRAVRGELSFFYGFAAAIMGIASVVSLSRGGMISLAAGLMFVVALSLNTANGSRLGQVRSSLFGLPAAFPRIGAVAVMLLIIGVGIWWAGSGPLLSRVERSELTFEARSSEDPRKETFFQSRGWIWRDTAAMIRDHWVTGVGLGAFQTAYPIYSRHDGSLLVSQAHNDYLQILADSGIVGAALLLWFIFVVARDAARALRHRDSMMAGTALGCAGGLFALLVHSLFDFNLQLPSNALLFLILTSVVSQIAAAASHGRVSQAFLERAIRLKVAT